MPNSVHNEGTNFIRCEGNWLLNTQPVPNAIATGQDYSLANATGLTLPADAIMALCRGTVVFKATGTPNTQYQLNMYSYWDVEANTPGVNEQHDYQGFEAGEWSGLSLNDEFLKIPFHFHCPLTASNQITLSAITNNTFAIEDFAIIGYSLP